MTAKIKNQAGRVIKNFPGLIVYWLFRKSAIAFNIYRIIFSIQCLKFLLTILLGLFDIFLLS